MSIISLFYASLLINFIQVVVLSIFIILAWPVSAYIRARMFGGTLMILKRMNGAFALVYGSGKGSIVDAGSDGSYIPNPAASGRFGGVPAQFTYEMLAVPPSLEAALAGQKLKDVYFKPESTLEKTATAAYNAGVLDDFDVSALYEYANAINPHYISSRIERKAAEILKNARNPIGTVAAYVTLISMVIIVGAIGYKMVMGSGGGSGEAIAQTASTALNMCFFSMI